MFHLAPFIFGLSSLENAFITPQAIRYQIYLLGGDGMQREQDEGHSIMTMFGE